MNAQYTPGPWTQGRSGAAACVWLDGHKQPMSGMGPEETWIDCNTEANARLIAAAPDLLEALERCLRFGGLCPDLADETRAAIAKATGVKA